MPKDRLTQHIENLKEDIGKLREGNKEIARFVSLQESLARAENVNKEILAAEEEIPALTFPKERKPRTRKQAKMPEMNGVAVGEPNGLHDPSLSTATEASA